MTITTEPTLVPGTWTGVATGAGNVTMTAIDAGVVWCITGLSGSPSLIHGHKLPRGVDKSLLLAADEKLFLRGSGVVVISADNPV